MIQGVLHKFAPEEKAVEAQGIDEGEEGSSSTPDKEDIEDENTTNEGQTVKILTKQAKIRTEPHDQDPIIVEESTFGGDGRGLEEEVPLSTEDEIQILPPPCLHIRA